MVKQSKPEAD